MKKNSTLLALLVISSLICSTVSATVNVGDTIYKVDFNLYPGNFTFTSGTVDYDIFTTSAAYASHDSIVNGVIFNNGPNKQRIHYKTSQSVNPSGNYSPETTDDIGATTGGMSFIKSSTSSGGAYFILPKLKGPFNFFIWSCSGVAYNQTFDTYLINNGVSTNLGTSTAPSTKFIKKSSFYYNGTDSVQIKIQCGNTQSSTNTNLYIYDVVVKASDGTTAIAQTTMDKIVVSTKLFDLYGRKATRNTPGILVEKIYYSDGSTKTRKILETER